VLSTDTLAAAYSGTAFWAEFPDRYVRLRVGDPSPDVDTALSETGADSWAFVTASNPRSELSTPTQNRQRHDALLRRVRDLGWPFVPGIGAGEVGDWPPEVSLLILGIPLFEAQDLGREFEQNAIVVGRRGEPARLHWCHKPSAG
jgi:hypothetical protein